MVRGNTDRPRRQRLLRWLVAGLWAGVPLVGPGCGASIPVAGAPDLANRDQAVQIARAADEARGDGGIRLVGYQEAEGPPLLIHRLRDDGEKDAPERAPAPTPAPAANPPAAAGVPAAPAPAAAAKELPISLDTVFRLAEGHNPRVGLAREKLHESLLQQASNCSGWLPNVYAGIAYYRHEGGIQDFSGRLLHSSTGAFYPGLNIQSELDLREATFRQLDQERKVWQQKAELSQVNSEVLLDASTTYIDLLTARRGEALARELDKYDQKLLDRAERTARENPGATLLVQSIRASVANRQGMIAKLRQQGNAASAKLVYLLGLPPETCLNPVEAVFTPIELVDVTPPPCDLLTIALTNGPGVRELEGILAVIQQGLDKSYGLHNLLPSVQVNVYEGLFGAGPGASLAFDNRLDIGLQLRWNLTQLFQAEQQRELGRSKHKQAMLNYQELRGKLAAGVLEARDSVLHGREQIGLAVGQIQHAGESYRLSDKRLEEDVKGATPTDVLLNIRNLEQAHYTHLQAIAAHNKAQVRLLILLGPQPKPAAAPAALPAPPPGKLQLPPPQEQDKKDDKAPPREPEEKFDKVRQ